MNGYGAALHVDGHILSGRNSHDHKNHRAEIRDAKTHTKTLYSNYVLRGRAKAGLEFPLALIDHIVEIEGLPQLQPADRGIE